MPSFTILRSCKPAQLAAWCALLLLFVQVTHQAPTVYNNKFNKTCRYAAYNISAELFINGIDGGYAFIAPLESNIAVNDYLQPWKACFGPNEQVDMKLLQSGKKLPCFYKQNKWGNYDYWEENACDILIRTNCYCYAVSKYVGSYCEPGLGSTGKPFVLPVKDCKAAVEGVVADGGKLVDRWTVYNKPTTDSHYMALAVKPAADAGDSGDFHFWKLDADKTWSYKAGDTLSRNSYRNGTLIRDIEAADARGAYTSFCGYFEVNPDSHKLVGNSYYFSNLPARFKLWRDVAVKGSVQTLDKISPGWLAAYKGYYADAGWEDGLYHRSQAARMAMPTSRNGHPHTYSVRPMSVEAKANAAAGASNNV